jgi:SWIM zinc finger
MLIRPLSSFVTLRNRVKGADYFRSGAVAEIAGGEWSAHALVRGTRDYRVDLRRESGTDRFTASCECPYYTDRADICKHIWAALLEADRRGLLNGDGAILPTASLEPEYRPTTDLPVAAHVPDSRRLAKSPQWEQFLSELQQDARAAERTHPAPRFSNGEIVYSIDVRGTLNGYGTVLNVLFRQRRKNGSWSKPRPASATPSEAEHLANPADREILSLLLGAGNPWTYGTTYEPGFSRSRYVPDPVAEVSTASATRKASFPSAGTMVLRGASKSELRSRGRRRSKSTDGSCATASGWNCESLCCF